MRLHIRAALAFLAAGAAAAAQSAPVGLDPGQTASLSRGEAVVRILDDASRLSLSPNAPHSADIRSGLAGLKPNYLVEVTAAFPPSPGTDPLAALAAALSDVGSYVGIPYYSERNRKTFDLFDKAVALSRGEKNGVRIVEALLHMKPFEDYRSRFELSAGSGLLYFSGANLDHLVYKGVKAVKPGDMRWYIVAFRSGDRYYFHGVGAVRAFDMFGAARDRLEPSFIGRTTAFFEGMIGRIGAAP